MKNGEKKGLSHYAELEAKLESPDVREADFFKWLAAEHKIVEMKRVEGYDTYYESSDGHVVRYREDRHGRHELTVKKRRSATSTRDRVEVDLPLKAKTTREDVSAFLCAAGFIEAFRVYKKGTVYWVELTKNLPATYSIYQCCKVRDDNESLWQHAHNFIEVEAEKGACVELSTANRRLQEEVAALRKKWGLKPPVNYSLYEFYSGKKYLIEENDAKE